VPQLAQVPVSTEVSMVAGAEAAIMIRDPQLDALLVAHRQFGGTSALQMPAGFLRNATFEGAAR
jgi:sigma-E factor negative regulatory protein RseA